MGRGAEQDGALRQCFRDQVEFKILQVAQSTVDQLRVASAGSRTEVGAIHQTEPERDAGGMAPESQVAEDARAVDSSADHQNVQRLFPELG